MNVTLLETFTVLMFFEVNKVQTGNVIFMWRLTESRHSKLKSFVSSSTDINDPKQLNLSFQLEFQKFHVQFYRNQWINSSENLPKRAKSNSSARFQTANIIITRFSPSRASSHRSSHINATSSSFLFSSFESLINHTRWLSTINLSSFSIQTHRRTQKRNEIADDFFLLDIRLFATLLRWCERGQGDETGQFMPVGSWSWACVFPATLTYKSQA